MANASPTVSIQAMAPGSPIHPGDQVTLTATGFAPNASLDSVIFGPVYNSRYAQTMYSATFDANGSATFQVTVPANLNPNDAYVTIWVTHSGAAYEDTATVGFSLTTTSPVPTISALSPSYGLAGTNVSISGSNFGTVKGTVYLQAPFQPVVKVTPTAWSDTSVTATIPANSANGALELWVNNGTILSNVETFTVGSIAPSTPVVSSISPTSGTTGTPITLTGSGFTDATTVYFDSQEVSFQVVSDTQMTVFAPSGASGSQGSIVVASGAGTSTDTQSDVFTYTSGSASSDPIVGHIDPASGTASGGTTVTITGSGLTGATAVDFGNIPAMSFQVLSDTEITATSPAGTSGSTVDITVTTQAGTSPVSAADEFTYTGGSSSTSTGPTITEISPTVGTASGGTTITIFGSGLTGATAVEFGGVAATSFQVVSDTEITAVSPAGKVGNAADLTVTTPAGTSSTSAADVFTYRTPQPPHLAFITEPSDIVSGTPLSVTAVVYGENNQIVSNNSDQISLFVYNSTLPTLLNTVSSYSSTAQNGVAVFTGVDLPMVASGYQLLAIDHSNANISGAFSQAFSVTPASSQNQTLSVSISTPNGTVSGLAGSILSIWSPSLQNGAAVTVNNGPGTYSLANLSPASDYTVTLKDSQNNVLYTKSDVTISSVANTLSLTLSPPASLSVQVTDESGNPLVDVPVSVTVQHSGSQLSDAGLTNQTGSLFPIPNLSAGDAVTISASPTGSQLYDSALVTESLVSGTNTPVVKLSPLPMATLSGQVTDDTGNPVIANINIKQTDQGRSFGFSTTSDAGGDYSVSVLAVPDTQVQAVPEISNSNYGNSSWTTVDLSSGSGTVHLIVPLYVTGQLTLQLTTTYAGSSAQTIPMNWRTAVHYGLTVTGQDGSVFLNNIISSMSMDLNSDVIPLFDAYAGEQVTIATTDAHSFGLQDQSQTVTLDQNGNATATLNLSQVMGIEGTVLDSQGNPVTDYTGSVYQLNGSGQKTWISDFSPGTSQFDVGLTQSGAYEVEIHDVEGMGYSPVVNVVSGQTTNVGNIPLMLGGDFYGQTGNDVNAQPNMVSPGGTVTVYADYHNGGTSTASQAHLEIDLPAGTSLVTGSVSLNGQAVTPTSASNGSQYLVPLGDVASGESGRLSYQLALAASATIPAFNTDVNIQYSASGQNMTEPVGSVTIQVNGVTLNAPNTVSTNQTTVSGNAPNGSTVTVYDGSQLLGSVTSGDNGYWQMDVTLANLGTPSNHTLTAQASTSAGTLYSNPVTVYDNANAPQLTNIEVSQSIPEANTYSFDPRQGTAHFPYIYVPGASLNVTLTFNKPQDVYDVQVFFSNLGDVTATLGTDGLYHAQINPGLTSVPGDIYVDYQTKTSLNELIAQGVPTASQVNSTMLPIFQNTSVQSAQQNADGNTITFSVPQANNAQATLTTTSLGTSNYTPTAADRALVKQTGIPIYDFQSSTETDSTGNTIEVFSYYVPTDQTTAQAAMAGDPPMELVEQTLTIAKQIMDSGSQYLTQLSEFVQSEQGNRLINNASNFNNWGSNSLPGQSLGNEYNKAVQLLNMDQHYLTASQISDFQSQLADQKQNMMMSFATYAFCTLAGTSSTFQTAGSSLMLNLVSSGVSALDQQEESNALFAITSQIEDDANQRQEQDLTNQMYHLQQQQQQELLQAWVFLHPNDPITMSPYYIIDPSGYVYEGLPQNRVSGVTAQIVTQDSQGNWQSWNATGFGQSNPETTNSQGQFEWNVPPGNYQVVLNKTGYISAQSQVVTVPPEQTGMNVGLVSQSPPTVTSVVAATQGSPVMVTFSQYMNATTLTPVNIAVYDSQNNPVSGTITPVDPIVSPNGVPLSLSASFMPDASLPAGQSYTMDVSKNVQNYGSNSMANSYTGTFTVPSVDPTPVVTGISPGYGLQTGGTSVVITGSHFTGATGVDFGSTPASSFIVDSDSQMIAIAPPGSGTVDVTVGNAAGSGSPSAASEFLYQSASVPSMPVITSISANSGPSDGGTQVVLTGQGFTGATAVYFGSFPAASFTVDSDTQMTAVSPLGYGTAPISVSTPDGTSGAGEAVFTYSSSTSTGSGTGTSISASGSTSASSGSTSASGGSTSASSGGTSGTSGTSANGGSVPTTNTAPELPTVLASHVFGSAGGTVQISTGNVSINVSVPDGAFAQSGTMTISTGNAKNADNLVHGLSSQSIALVLGVNFSGATPVKPVTVTITDPRISANAVIYKLTADGHLAPMKSVVHAGKAVLSFTSDPDFVALNVKKDERVITMQDWAGIVPGLVSTDPAYGNTTTYMPIWYIMQMLKTLNIRSTWDGRNWRLTAATQPIRAALLPGKGSMHLYLNGKLVQSLSGIYAKDPSTRKNTTYMPVWYVMQLLKTINMSSVWDGTTWTLMNKTTQSGTSSSAS